MYYYIFDIKKCKKKSQVDSIKSYLASLGISGEYTYPSAAQSISELVELGLSKQYTTIVGIGSDEIANEIAGKLVGRKEAMGFIPLEISPELATVIGADNWKDACDILRFRKINEIKLGRTASGQHFLTSAKLDIKSPVEVTMELKDCMVQAKVKSFLVANLVPSIKKIGDEYLDIVMESVDPKGTGLMSKISSIFTTDKENNIATSLFRARSLRIFTKNQIPIICGEQVLAKTPQFIESTDESLRLITAKKSTNFWEDLA